MAKAMVKPAPAGPSPSELHRLASILEMFGNDRAYTVIHASKKSWTVMFEGDYTPRVITFEDEKPVIK